MLGQCSGELWASRGRARGGVGTSGESVGERGKGTEMGVAGIQPFWVVGPVCSCCSCCCWRQLKSDQTTCEAQRERGQDDLDREDQKERVSTQQDGFVWRWQVDSHQGACNQSKERHEKSQRTQREVVCLTVIVGVIVVVNDRHCHCSNQYSGQ